MRNKNCPFILCLAFSATVFQQRALANDTGNASPRYDLKVQLFPADRRMEAQGTISIPKSDGRRDSLILVLNDTMRDFRVDVVEPAESAGEAKLEKKEGDRGQTRWTIRPRKPIPAAEPARLQFSHAGGEKATFVFSLGPESSFASGLNAAWEPEVEGANDRGTGFLRLSTPPGYVAISGGIPLHSADDAAE